MEGFVRLVDGRAKVVLLLETAAAVVRLHDILGVAGIDEVMVGLNDLHLSMAVANHFELVASDLMTMISDQVRERGLRFGFGGLARAFDDRLPVPSDLVMAQHARLSSTSAWISRSLFGRDPASVDLAVEIARLRERLAYWFAQPKDVLDRAARRAAPPSARNDAMSTEPRAYTTYFDQRYLAFALVTLRSIRKHDPQADIFALCFDRVAFDTVAGLGDHKIIAVSTDAIREYQPHLALLDDVGRPRLSLYATHKPVMPLYTMIVRPHLAAVAHIDADVCFYSSPQPLYDEIGGASVALSPHRFADAWKHSEEFGTYNAGFIYWRNDAEGRRCLTDYRKDCFDWCEPWPQPDGRFMNQGYLTSWPARYSNVHVIRHPGVNLSWWNVAAHALERGPVVSVDGQPLIFYHFSYLYLDALGIWRTLREFGDNDALTIQEVYAPYLEEIERTDRDLRSRIPSLSAIERIQTAAITKPVRRGPWPRTREGFVARARWQFGRSKRTERAGL